MATKIQFEQSTAKLDGRKKRSDISREKIVRAFLQLVKEGNISPSAEEVAITADVGLRTVFRRFKEMELLYREMIIELQNKFTPEVAKPWETVGMENRLQELLTRKATIYEDLMPYRIASNYHKHHSEFIKKGNRHWMLIEQKVLESILPFDLATHRVLFTAIEISLSFDTWVQLRVDHDLTPSQTYETMKLSLKSLLVK